MGAGFSLHLSSTLIPSKKTIKKALNKGLKGSHTPDDYFYRYSSPVIPHIRNIPVAHKTLRCHAHVCSNT